jgi:hypothetical protein
VGNGYRLRTESIGLHRRCPEPAGGPYAASRWAYSNRPTACAGWLTVLAPREPLGASRGQWLSATHRTDRLHRRCPEPAGGPYAASRWPYLNRPTACARWLTVLAPREPLGASRGQWLSAPHRTDRTAPPVSRTWPGPNAVSRWAYSNRPTACAGWLTVLAPREPLGASRGQWLSATHRTHRTAPQVSRTCWGPIRCVQVGLFKSPNRLRWLAHSARTL